MVVLCDRNASKVILCAAALSNALGYLVGFISNS
jgi:hypothetical protein